MNKIAKVISNIFSPYVVAPVTIFLVAAKTLNIQSSLFFTALTFTSLVIPPLVYILVKMKQGIIKDIFVKDRKQRTPLYFIGLVCIAITFYLYNLFLAPENLYKTLIAVTITLLACLIVNKFTKVSIHMASLCGAVTALYFIYGNLVIIPAFFTVLITAWARIYTKNHTLKQVVLGTSISIVITALVFITS